MLVLPIFRCIHLTKLLQERAGKNNAFINDYSLFISYPVWFLLLTISLSVLMSFLTEIYRNDYFQGYLQVFQVVNGYFLYNGYYFEETDGAATDMFSIIVVNFH